MNIWENWRNQSRLDSEGTKFLVVTRLLIPRVITVFNILFLYEANNSFMINDGGDIVTEQKLTYLNSIVK